MTSVHKHTSHHPTKKHSGISHMGMMGDGTEEQSLGERGDPSKRIKKKDVATAFSKKPHKKA
ncbi:MAG TPA: hypothetical protein VNQ56_16770 [Pseudolabrys sp.]|nr:hypothetical protein [Pseudolabrys sp.]